MWQINILSERLNIMVGIGFDINNIIKELSDEVLSQIDIINLENPLYPNYLNSDYKSDIERFLSKRYDKTIITDGAYIDLNPGTGESEIRSIVKDKIRQSIDFAISVKSSEIIFLSTFLPMIQLDFYDNAHIDNSIAFWKEIVSENKEIRISLCNTFEYNPDVLLKIAKGVDCENFGLAFDIGHAFAFGKAPLITFFDRVKPFCKTVYIHSNNQVVDEHLNLFEGKLLKSKEFQDIIPMIQDMNIILKPFDKSKLNENLEVLRKMYSGA